MQNQPYLDMLTVRTGAMLATVARGRIELQWFKSQFAISLDNEFEASGH